MSAHRHPLRQRPIQDALSEILNFGPEPAEVASHDLSERIRKVKEKIKEINERIFRLTSRNG